MSVETRTIYGPDEMKAFYQQASGMVPDYLQLSRGRGGHRMQTVSLDGVTLIWSRTDVDCSFRDHMQGEGLMLGFATRSRGRVTVRGVEAGPQTVQVWLPGEELDYVMRGPLETLEVTVDPSLAGELGWAVGGDPLRDVSRPDLQRLTGACRVATALASSEASGAGAALVEPRDRVLDALDPVLERWRPPADGALLGGSNRYDLVRRAKAHLDAHGDDARLEVADLAESLGVPRRTLFHAFRTVLGVGPHRYLQLRRLDRLHARLRAAHAGETSVTRIALELGFANPGRLAGLYRQRFGESPRETLARACS